MIVARPDRPPLRVPAQGRALHDSIGAGDTAVATLATLLAAGAELEFAAQIANAAAGISVSRVGTTAVHPHEIDEVVSGIAATKVLHVDDLVPLVERWRSIGQRIVFANGCFDLFHAGHLSLLQNAARCGDRLVVAINSDASVRRLKGEDRPVIAGPERAALVAALACVDAVTIYDDDTPLQTIAALRPDVLVKGRDYSIDQVVGREFVEANGGRVELVALAPEKSTSGLIDRIARKWGTV
jgi:D-beta-D-heptose 7-phosphate kinase/D-beta-D-heptose 1-phosphate adenosyltransferase